jgi:hypothetical protein
LIHNKHHLQLNHKYKHSVICVAQEHGHKDAHYDFGYEVSNPGGYGKQPQVFGHGETRHGDVTKGRYHVLLPDGRHQKVAYTADHSGFHAQVSYTNQAHHPHK